MSTPRTEQFWSAHQLGRPTLSEAKAFTEGLERENARMREALEELYNMGIAMAKMLGWSNNPGFDRAKAALAANQPDERGEG